MLIRASQAGFTPSYSAIAVHPLIKVKQMTETIIAQEYQGFSIQQRAVDGYVDATAMCNATGKKFNDYSRLKTTRDFLDAVSFKAGIPVSLLIQTKRGGTDVEQQGTWIHPRVAINLGQWCSPEFAVFVSDLVIDWIEGRRSLELTETNQKLAALEKTRKQKCLLEYGH